MIKVPPIIDTDTFALARSRLKQGARLAARNAKNPGRSTLRSGLCAS
jgi:hypothetical protein